MCLGEEGAGGGNGERQRNITESITMGLDHVALIHIYTTEKSREFCLLLSLDLFLPFLHL